MGWYGVGPGWADWVLMTVTMMASWGVLGLAGFALYRSLRHDNAPSVRQVWDAESVLDERLARGEIDVEEYTKRRDALRAVR